MNDAEPQFIVVGEGSESRKIAYLRQTGSPPGLLWLQGFKSEMVSIKAAALSTWCRQNGRALTRFDYSGHGQSDGRFEDGTLSRWIEEATAVFRQLTEDQVIIVGSSMGGNIALLLLKRLLANNPAEAARIERLVLIAPAWDMTEELMWRRFTDEARQAVMRDGVFLRPSQYGDPYPITRRLIEDGRANLMGLSPWDPGRPVDIIHGRRDSDVPFHHSERLIEILRGHRIRLTEVADGEHRLSRPQDLDLLFQTIGTRG